MFGLARFGIPFAIGAVTSSKVSSTVKEGGEGINFIFWGVLLIAGLFGLRLLATTLTAVKKAF